MEKRNISNNVIEITSTESAVSNSYPHIYYVNSEGDLLSPSDPKVLSAVETDMAKRQNNTINIDSVVKKLETGASMISFEGSMLNLLNSILNRITPDNTVVNVYGDEERDGSYYLRIVQNQIPDHLMDKDVVEWDEMTETMDKTIVFKNK